MTTSLITIYPIFVNINRVKFQYSFLCSFFYSWFLNFSFFKSIHLLNYLKKRNDHLLVYLYYYKDPQ